MTIEKRLATLESKAASERIEHIICSEDGDVWMLEQAIDESDEAFRGRIEGLALQAARYRRSELVPAFTSAPWLIKPTPANQSAADAAERNPHG